MVFCNIGYNQSVTANSHFNYAFNHKTNSASRVIWGKSFCENLSSQISSQVTKFKIYFSHDSNLFNKNIHNQHSQDWQPSFPINKLMIHDPANILFKHNLTNTHTLSPVLERSIKFITKNPKSQHLFNQIRTFRAGRHVKEERHKMPGLCNRIKTFFGLSEIDEKSRNLIRKDLEKFQSNMAKEKLTPEENQRLLLAFVEGYILAKENLTNQTSSSKFYYLSIAAVVFGFCLVFFNRNNISAMFKNSNLSIEVSESNVKFSDVKGADEAKEELKNVVEFLKNPEKFSALGGKLPKGVLLVGPPGTGKTLLAKAVAGEAGVPFFSTSGPEFDEIYVGVGARRIRELFKLAKENIPCVIFIDEIDSIGKERTSSSLHPHANDTINQLLAEMDGFRNSGGIIVLGATNRKDDLDKALLRPGRFDIEVTVLVPDYNGRKELIEFYLNQVRHQNIDVEKLARGTTNFTGADIENLVNQAALRAAVIGAQYVSMEHLEYARDKALMGPESISRIVDEETNRITAYHEGGHTVVAYFTEHAQPLHKVTIIARGSSLGHTAYIPDKDVYHVTKTQLLAMLDSMMGGRAAEELVFGSEKITSGASSDLEKATELASKMVKRWGMSESVGLSTYHNQHFISPQTANLIDMEVKKILQDSYERAKNILITHKDKHREISEALLKYETLDANEITAIMKGEKDIFKKPHQKFS